MTWHVYKKRHVTGFMRADEVSLAVYKMPLVERFCLQTPKLECGLLPYSNTGWNSKLQVWLQSDFGISNYFLFHHTILEQGTGDQATGQHIPTLCRNPGILVVVQWFALLIYYVYISTTRKSTTGHRESPKSTLYWGHFIITMGTIS